MTLSLTVSSVTAKTADPGRVDGGICPACTTAPRPMLVPTNCCTWDTHMVTLRATQTTSAFSVLHACQFQGFFAQI